MDVQPAGDGGQVRRRAVLVQLFEVQHAAGFDVGDREGDLLAGRRRGRLPGTAGRGAGTPLAGLLREASSHIFMPTP